MELEQTKFLDQRMKRIPNMAVGFQFLAFFTANLVLWFQPTGYREIGQIFSITALLLSFIISKAYIYTGRQLEIFKSFSPEQIEIRRREYALKFFSPYGLWVLFSSIFTMS